MVNTPQRRFVAEHVSERALIANGATLAVTTFDLMTGEEVVHRYPGDPLPIVDAVMAAVATPGLLAPQRSGDRLLAEATLIESVPVAAIPTDDPPERVVGVLAGIPLDGPSRPPRGSTGRGEPSPIGRSRSTSPTTRAGRSSAPPRRPVGAPTHAPWRPSWRRSPAVTRELGRPSFQQAVAPLAEPAPPDLRLDQPVRAARLSAAGASRRRAARSPPTRSRRRVSGSACEDRPVPHARRRPHRVRGRRRAHVGRRGRHRLRRDRHLLGGCDQRIVRGHRAGRRARRAVVDVARPRHPRASTSPACSAAPCCGRRASCATARNDAASSTASSPAPRSATASASAPTSPTSRPGGPTCTSGRARTCRLPRASTPRSRCRRWCARR